MKTSAKPKIDNDFIVEFVVSARQRAESLQSQKNGDHVAGEGFTFLTHYNWVHKFFSIPQAMKISDAKVAVGKEWKKLETIPA